MLKFIRKNPKVFTALIVAALGSIGSQVSPSKVLAQFGVGASFNQNGGQTAGTIYNFNPPPPTPYEFKQPPIFQPLDRDVLSPRPNGGLKILNNTCENVKTCISVPSSMNGTIDGNKSINGEKLLEVRPN